MRLKTLCVVSHTWEQGMVSQIWSLVESTASHPERKCTSLLCPLAFTRAMMCVDLWVCSCPGQGQAVFSVCGVQKQWRTPEGHLSLGSSSHTVQQGPSDYPSLPCHWARLLTVTDAGSPPCVFSSEVALTSTSHPPRTSHWLRGGGWLGVQGSASRTSSQSWERD